MKRNKAKVEKCQKYLQPDEDGTTMWTNSSKAAQTENLKHEDSFSERTMPLGIFSFAT